MANFTEKAIKASFLKLLNERPLTKITVRDIVEDCGINRNSFYYHYRDIPALLEELITEQADNIMKKYPSITSLEEAFRAALEFSMENKRAVLHIYNSVSRDNFEQYALRICSYVVNTYAVSALKDKVISDADTKALCRFIKCSLFGLYIDWLGGNMKEDILSDLARLARLARLAAAELAHQSENTES